MTTNSDPGSGFAIVDPDDVENPYGSADVPGEFRALTSALGCEQLAVTLIRVPAHPDATKLDDFWEASPLAAQRVDTR